MHREHGLSWLSWRGNQAVTPRLSPASVITMLIISPDIHRQAHRPGRDKWEDNIISDVMRGVIMRPRDTGLWSHLGRVAPTQPGNVVSVWPETDHPWPMSMSLPSDTESAVSVPCLMVTTAGEPQPHALMTSWLTPHLSPLRPIMMGQEGVIMF